MPQINQSSKQLQIIKKELLPKGELNGGTGEAFYLDTDDYRFMIKGAGGKYSTTVTEKEGLVVAFYNALNEGWNPTSLSFDGSNMISLLNSFLSNISPATVVFAV